MTFRTFAGLWACLALRASAACTPSDTTFCMGIDVFLGETGYYTVQGKDGPSPELTVKIGETYTFDQTDGTNWYHPVGFAFYPDGAHGATWGGDERSEVEEPYLSYKIDGVSPTGECAPLGLDCYEPEFFFPKSWWATKTYTAELNVTKELAEASCGGVIYYFCHIHSKMSAKIVIKNADGSDLNTSGYTCPDELTLYSPATTSGLDATCGTHGANSYSATGDLACDRNLLEGTLDTDFEKCLQAIDCKMLKEMRVLGYDEHNSPIATFMQQMIPHHLNAVNMARLLMKTAPAKVSEVEDLEDILWDIINVQNYQVHQFRAYLGTHTEYLQAVDGEGNALTATSVGHHCDGTLAQGTNLAITEVAAPSGATSGVAGCTPSSTRICVKVNHFAGESGYYEFAGETGPSPEITAKIGDTLVFDQSDPTNWYHPIGFAYYPDGAHGAEWGGDERDEIEGAGELTYKIDGAATTCPDAGDTGLDCYEPEFFYPREEWAQKNYSAELTITQEMADASHGGVVYYFCHIHSKMSGKIRIQNSDGSAFDASSLSNPTELALYAPTVLDNVDKVCGATDLAEFCGGGGSECDTAYLCGALDTTWERCMQAIDCKMATHMTSMTTAESDDPVATFCQQMIPHHLNAVNMAKVLLKQASEQDIEDAMEEGALTHILYTIISAQNYQIHQFRNYLGTAGYLGASDAVDGGTNATSNPHEPIAGYRPVSDVVEHKQVPLDVEAIAAAAEKHDWTLAKQVYTDGLNSCKSTTTRRTLQGFVSETTADKKLVGEAFFGSFRADGTGPTGAPIPGSGRLSMAKDFWDSFMLDALDGKGDFAGRSDAARKVAVKQGAVGALTLYTTHELESAISKAMAGNTADTEAAHAWDEAWAFYHGKETASAGEHCPWDVAKSRDADFAGNGAVSAHGVVLGYFNAGLRASRVGTLSTDTMVLARDNIYRLLALSAIRGALKHSYLMQNPPTGTYSEEHHVAAYASFLAAAGWVEQGSPDAGKTALELLDFKLAEQELNDNVHCALKAALVPAYAGLGLDCEKVGAYSGAPGSACDTWSGTMPACPAISVLPGGLASYAPLTDTDKKDKKQCPWPAEDTRGEVSGTPAGRSWHVLAVVVASAFAAAPLAAAAGA